MTDSAVVAAVLVGAAAFSIGLSKAGLGGSIGPLATILMLSALPAREAVGLQLPILIAGDAIALALLWRKWDTRIVLSALPGVVVGVILGTLLLDAIPAGALKIVVGAIAVLFGVWALIVDLTKRELERPGPSGWVAPLVAGSVTGTTSAIAHAGGPPMTMYLLTRRLDPRTFVATSAAIFTVVNLLKVPLYAVAGVFDWELQLQYLWAFALVPVGAVIGRLLLSRIPGRAFRIMVTVGLFVGGVLLITT